jgi:aerobic carbon-monoxide dehydrogenase large subunit
MNKRGMHYIGQPVLRIEDDNLLRGKGQFVDDINIPNTFHVGFVRSQMGHAIINQIDVREAQAVPGVLAVLCADDLKEALHSLRLPLAFPAGKLDESSMPQILASTEVAYVGEALAMVIAETRHIAEDAVDLVYVEYDELPALVDPREAMENDADMALSDTSSNCFTTIEIDYGDCDSAFDNAAHVFHETFFLHRGAAHPMEGRGILSVVDPGSGAVTLWASTQASHELRNTAAEMLMKSNDDVRVIPCDVGGGFGSKFMVYPEEIAVAAASVILKVPVKWVEDRREHFLSAIQERDQYWDVEVAVSEGGTLQAIRGKMTHDQGAYAPHAITVPYNSVSSVIGAYVLPSYKIEAHVVRTNKPPVIPVRGAGYQQGTFVIERIMDRIAAELNEERSEIRRRNLIQSSQMPYSTGLKNRAGAPVIYDSGDYLACQEEVLLEGDYNGFPERQAAALREGRYIGLGLAHGVKCTGRGPFETATVRVSISGEVSVYTGANAIGQSTKTTLAQICADKLGVNIEQVKVVCGDTAYVQYGLGAFGSRQTMLAGNAVAVAAGEIHEKALEVARQLFKTADGIPVSKINRKLFIENGHIRLIDYPEIDIPLSQIASIMRGAAGYSFPNNVGVGLEATHHFRADQMAYANGVHLCEVEVNPVTGHVNIDRYLALHDCGKIINPLTAKGQIQGGMV